MKRILAALCAGAALTLGGAAQAADIVFDLHGDSASDGYMTGTFFGLADSGSSAPTRVELTAYSYYGQFTPFSEFVSGSSLFSTGGFDIENGHILDSTFSFTNLAGGGGLVIDTANGGSFSSFLNGWDFHSYADVRLAEGGYLDLSVSSAPEPATWTLLIAGLSILGGLLRWRPRKGLTNAGALNQA